MTLLLVLLMNAHAGIRLIHGGGGYAEMLALTFQSRIPRLLAQSEGSPRIEGLRRDARNLALIFSGAESSPDELLIPSADLYTPQGRPRDPTEIARLVFDAWARRIAGEPVDLSAKVIPEGQILEETIEMEHTTLHVLRTLSDIGREAILFEDHEGGTRDVTRDLTSHLGCNETAHLLDLEGFFEVANKATARAIWSCAGKRYRADLLIDPANGFSTVVSRKRTATCGEEAAK